MKAGRFLCGCAVFTDDENAPPLQEDNEGFVVCPLHLKRRYGWRGSSSHGRPGAALLPRPGWSALEQEQYELYGTLPKRPVSEIHESDPDIQERAHVLRHLIPLQAMAELRERNYEVTERLDNRESFPSDR